MPLKIAQNRFWRPIHGGCIGGGIDVVVACDMRYYRTMRISPKEIETWVYGCRFGHTLQRCKAIGEEWCVKWRLPETITGTEAENWDCEPLVYG
jgi:hypothetical protein